MQLASVTSLHRAVW